jgi:hypothetical protein
VTLPDQREADPVHQLAADNDRAVRGCQGTDPARDLRAAVEGLTTWAGIMRASGRNT